jgi:hypothetical protein
MTTVFGTKKRRELAAQADQIIYADRLRKWAERLRKKKFPEGASLSLFEPAFPR